MYTERQRERERERERVKEHLRVEWPQVGYNLHSGYSGYFHDKLSFSLCYYHDLPSYIHGQILSNFVLDFRYDFCGNGEFEDG